MSVQLRRRRVRDASGWLLTSKNRAELESICGTPVENPYTYDEVLENATYYLVVCSRGVDELFQKSEAEFSGIVSALRAVLGEEAYESVTKEAKRRLEVLRTKAGEQVSDSAGSVEVFNALSNELSGYGAEMSDRGGYWGMCVRVSDLKDYRQEIDDILASHHCEAVLKSSGGKGVWGDDDVNMYSVYPVESGRGGIIK